MAGNVSTRIEVFTNISYPLDNSHVRRFENLSSQTAYFDGLTKGWTGDNYKYSRVDNYEFTIRITGKIANAQRFGYARLKNIFDSGTKWYYCFVNKVLYIDDNTIELQLSLDFYQTYVFDMEILPSFVERQHEPLWQSNGLPVVNTVPEDVNYGDEYNIINQRFVAFQTFYYTVIVSKKPIGSYVVADDDRVNGGRLGVQTGLHYYIIPFELDTDYIPITITQVGNEYIPPNYGEIQRFLSKDDEAVNNIVAMFSTIYIGSDWAVGKSGSGTNARINLDSVTNGNFMPVKITIPNDRGDVDRHLIEIANIKRFTQKIYNVTNKYQNVPNYTESKLMLSPYTIFVLTDFKGNQIELKPEYVIGSDFTFAIRGSISEMNKTSVEVRNYINALDDNTSYLKALIDTSPNKIAWQTDSLADYLQGEGTSVETRKALASRNRNVEIGTSAINAIPSMFTGWIGAGFGASSFASSAINAENRRYNEVKSLEAKQDDISNVPPSVSNMGGNNAFEWGNDFIFPRIITKTVTDEYRKKLTDYFNMYGYQKNELVEPNLHTRRYWNYIKCVTLNVQSGMNREIILRFKKIFEEGVTLWHDDDMFNYNRNNTVL